MRTMMALLTLSMLFAACSGGGGGSTPESTFEAVKSVAAAKDWEGFYDLFGPSDRAKAEKKWEEYKKQFDTPQGKMGLQAMAGLLGLDAEKIPQMSFREYFVAILGAMVKKGGPEAGQLAAIANAAITDKKVEGDQATLKFKAGETEDDLKLVKEGGSWYMAGDILMGMIGN